MLILEQRINKGFVFYTLIQWYQDKKRLSLVFRSFDMPTETYNVIQITDYHEQEASYYDGKLTDSTTHQYSIHNKSNMKYDGSASVVCPQCGVSSTSGIWHWDFEISLLSVQKTCPACKRINENNPSSLLMLKGLYFKNNRSDILQIIYRTTNSRMKKFPMCRLIDVEQLTLNSVIIGFTDRLSAFKVGKKIARTFDGDIDYKKAYITGIVRVSWPDKKWGINDN